jgi:hypothetical protein
MKLKGRGKVGLIFPRFVVWLGPKLLERLHSGTQVDVAGRVPRRRRLTSVGTIRADAVERGRHHLRLRSLGTTRVDAAERGRHRLLTAYGPD